MGKGGGCFLV